MATLQTKGLTYCYSAGTPFEKVAVDHVDLEIPSGAFVGLIGHTGSGKSTLIQHLNGLLRPTEGTVLLDGEDIWADKKKIRQVRFRVGLVFQYPEYQIFEETVARDIAFGPRNMGLPEEEVQARVREAAIITGLTPAILEQSPFLLSGGQKRRVAIAGIMAMRPEILILDEPAAGLDAGAGGNSAGDRRVPPADGCHHCAGFPQHGGRGAVCGIHSGDERRKNILL
ncbi:cobalt ABC transporter ATP-binding protein [Ruminococcus sp. CAG:330]|nr:cobalt ABC transporter ATP-binding protein [Ruminococcus sp. CAG:330]